MSAQGVPAAGSVPRTGCRALVAGFGVPTQRDLDFGRQVIRYLEPFRWPAGVVVEDLSYTAHLALHRLQELQPPKLVLVGAFPRGTGRPGEVRLRRIAPAPRDEKSVHEQLTESLMGVVDLNHTLGVLQHWGALPADTALIEVEPDDCTFGLGFSEALGASLDEILEIIRKELGAGSDLTLVDDDPTLAPETEGAAALDGGVARLAEYAEARRQARLHERRRGAAAVATRPEAPGVEVVVRSQAWGMGLDGGSDWFDVVPLGDDTLGLIIGEAPGRGVEAAALKTDLRVVAQAYALVFGASPADVVECLDRWVAATGRGEGATVAYLTLERSSGRLRLCTAGHCPPLVVAGRGADPGASHFLHDDFTPALGATGGRHRGEDVSRFGRDDVLLLFTDGLVERPNRPLAFGLLELQEAAALGSHELETLCAHVFDACLDRRRREDDASLVGLRLRQ